VPIVVGGHSDAAARRAGRFGDGFFPAATPERVGELIAIMRRAAKDAGRNPDEIEITSGGAPVADLDEVKRYEDLGVSRLVVPVPTFDPRELDAAFGRLHEDLISKVS
jgi:alkanesulfonate monooxygenase SsuD/methylene tetrahydromethanopterin reductase-like flavin-dependent oxidoreductase (luciferase family)